MSALALLVVCCGCATGSRPPCVEQSNEALMEIESGRLEELNPAVAAWEREQARACGWVISEDFNPGADPD